MYIICQADKLQMKYSIEKNTCKDAYLQREIIHDIKIKEIKNIKQKDGNLIEKAWWKPVVPVWESQCEKSKAT